MCQLAQLDQRVLLEVQQVRVSCSAHKGHLLISMPDTATTLTHIHYRNRAFVSCSMLMGDQHSHSACTLLMMINVSVAFKQGCMQFQRSLVPSTLECNYSLALLLAPKPGTPKPGTLLPEFDCCLKFCCLKSSYRHLQVAARKLQIAVNTLVGHTATDSGPAHCSHTNRLLVGQLKGGGHCLVLWVHRLCTGVCGSSFQW